MPFERPLHLFTGKGGVGKSTLVAALALEAAQRGLRPIAVELGHRASLQSILRCQHIGYAPTEVAPGVFATNLELDPALADYVARRVRIRAIADRVARSATLRRFFEAAPAVAEVLTLERLQILLRDYSPVLVDLDATGHALMFLELPAAFEGLATGPLRPMLQSFEALLANQERTRLHLVTLPDRLPVQETLELYAHLRTAQRAPLGSLFVNRVPAPPLPPGAIELARAMITRIDHEGAREDLELAIACANQHADRMAEIERLRAVALPHVVLPDLEEPVDLAGLRELGRIAAEAIP